MIFLRMSPVFNPTIEVVTFRLRDWCMLGVLLLTAFTRLGHEMSGSIGFVTPLGRFFFFR